MFYQTMTLQQTIMLLQPIMIPQTMMTPESNVIACLGVIASLLSRRAICNQLQAVASQDISGIVASQYKRQ